MAICVQDTMVVKNMGGSNEAFEEIFKTNFFAFGEISCGHGGVDLGE